VGVEVAFVRVFPIVAHFSELGFEGLPHVAKKAGLLEEVRGFFGLPGEPLMGERRGIVLEMLVALLACDGVQLCLRNALGQALPMFLRLAVFGAQQGLQAVMPHALVEDDAGERIVRGFTVAQFHIAGNDDAVAGLGIVEALGGVELFEVLLGKRMLLRVVRV